MLSCLVNIFEELSQFKVELESEYNIINNSWQEIFPLKECLEEWESCFALLSQREKIVEYSS